jgi:hypothetical protein
MLRMLVTGGPPNLGGGGMADPPSRPQRSVNALRVARLARGGVQSLQD